MRSFLDDHAFKCFNIQFVEFPSPRRAFSCIQFYQKRSKQNAKLYFQGPLVVLETQIQGKYLSVFAFIPFSIHRSSAPFTSLSQWSQYQRLLALPLFLAVSAPTEPRQPVLQRPPPLGPIFPLVAFSASSVHAPGCTGPASPSPLPRLWTSSLSPLGT